MRALLPILCLLVFFAQVLPAEAKRPAKTPAVDADAVQAASSKAAAAKKPPARQTPRSAAGSQPQSPVQRADARPAAAADINQPDANHLRAILLGARGKPTAIGYVVDLDSGKVVLNLHGKRSIYPASVSKMFATAAILRALPLQRSLRTVVTATRKGPIASTLAIVGSGDPSLTEADLDKLAVKVAKRGIKEVRKLVIDATVFDDLLPAGYDEKQTDASYRAPVAGLQINSGAVTIVIKSRGAGRKPTVELRPRGAAYVVVNEASTVKGRGKPLQVTSSGAGRRTRIIVRGKFGARRKQIATRRRVHDAAFVAGHAFREALLRAGVRLTGKLVFERASPRLRRVATHQSRPLLQLVKTCNQTSHNGYAESFYKLLGATRKGAPGSSAKGQAAAREVLGDLGVDFDRLRLRNGSGLYHANKVTAKQVVALLVGMSKLGKIGKAWRSTLAIGGAAGTLRNRLRGPATKRRIFAKTGTLDDVTALAGYASGSQRRYAFALFFNDVKGPARIYRRVHDRFLTALLDPGASSAKEK